MTDPTVTVDSGYPASRFFWDGPVAALPVSRTQSTLAPREAVPGGGLDSDLTTTFEAGFDSTRQVDTSVIPSGGGTQTVTVTVAPR